MFFGNKIYLIINNPKYYGNKCIYCNRPFTDNKESKYKIVEGYTTGIYCKDGQGQRIELIANYYDDFKEQYCDISFAYIYVDNKQELIVKQLDDFYNYDEGPYFFQTLEQAQKWIEEFGG